MGNKCGAHTVPYIKKKTHPQQLSTKLQLQKLMRINSFIVIKEV